MRKGLLHLILITFLSTGLFPTPLYAAEALKEGAVTLSRADSSSRPFAQSILGISPLLIQSTEDEKGLLDAFTGLFKSDSKKSQEQSLENSTIPANQKAPVGKKEASPKKVRELTEKRTKNAKFYELSDGRIQAEIASDPIHYKDAKGKWQNIDPTVTTTDESGYAFGNKKNNFHTFFGKKADKLLKFRLDKHLIQLGVDGAEDKNLSPVVKSNTVTYSDLFPDADVKYTITSKSLKEDIILKKAPDNPVFTFTLKMGGRGSETAKGRFHRLCGQGRRTGSLCHAQTLHDGQPTRPQISLRQGMERQGDANRRTKGSQLHPDHRSGQGVAHGSQTEISSHH